MKNMNVIPKLLLLFLAMVSPAAADPTPAAPAAAAVSAENLAILRQIASLRDRLTRVRMGSFENITLEDVNKTAGIIAEYLNRAELKLHNLASEGGRFGWSWAGFDPPAGLVAQAEQLLNTLAAGKDPFAGKYAEPGGYVVDHAIIEKDGLHHVFYIRGTAVTSWPDYPLLNFGHAVSSDLIHWKTEKPVLQCPAEGWDTYQVWAPHIIERGGTYYMFYTGVNQNVSQTICLATSTDLYNWKRSGKNPVLKSPSWGIWSADSWSDCRDPMVLKDGDTYYLYYTVGRKVPETGQPEYSVGIFSSKDLLDWKDEGFIRLTESLATPPESPFVVKRDGRYYLFYSNYKYGIAYAVSDNPVKGWKELPPEEMAVLPGVSASEIFQDGDQWHMSYISHDKNGLHFLEVCKLHWDKEGRPYIDRSTREASVAEAFGKAMRGNVKVPGRDEFRQRPITVECMAKLDSAASYNVLVASDTKASAQHWSLYSAPGSGYLTLFQPGRGGEIVAETNICDGKWHAIAAVIEEDRIRLFVDGKLVKDAPAAPLQGTPLPGKLAIGDIAEGGLGCDGLVDNVRISRGAREIGSAPAAPLVKDEATLGLGDFDEPSTSTN
jgi:hypothetical protein